MARASAATARRSFGAAFDPRANSLNLLRLVFAFVVLRGISHAMKENDGYVRLAATGLIPFVCAAGPFLSGRATEQIKADVAAVRKLLSKKVNKVDEADVAALRAAAAQLERSSARARDLARQA